MTPGRIIFVILLVVAYLIGCYAIGKLFDRLDAHYRCDKNNDEEETWKK